MAGYAAGFFKYQDDTPPVDFQAREEGGYPYRVPVQ
jgi:hypothetical protein